MTVTASTGGLSGFDFFLTDKRRIGDTSCSQMLSIEIEKFVIFLENLKFDFRDRSIIQVVPNSILRQAENRSF